MDQPWVRATSCMGPDNRPGTGPRHCTGHVSNWNMSRKHPPRDQEDQADIRNINKEKSHSQIYTKATILKLIYLTNETIFYTLTY